MLGVALALVAIGVLLLFLLPWGGIVVGLAGVVLFGLTVASRIGRPASRSRV
jgi:hypothetical protein